MRRCHLWRPHRLKMDSSQQIKTRDNNLSQIHRRKQVNFSAVQRGSQLPKRSLGMSLTSRKRITSHAQLVELKQMLVLHFHHLMKLLNFWRNLQMHSLIHPSNAASSCWEINNLTIFSLTIPCNVVIWYISSQ